jgi:hypothetical protein
LIFAEADTGHVDPLLTLLTVNIAEVWVCWHIAYARFVPFAGMGDDLLLEGIIGCPHEVNLLLSGTHLLFVLLKTEDLNCELDTVDEKRAYRLNNNFTFNVSEEELVGTETSEIVTELGCNIVLAAVPVDLDERQLLVVNKRPDAEYAFHTADLFRFAGRLVGREHQRVADRVNLILVFEFLVLDHTPWRLLGKTDNLVVLYNIKWQISRTSRFKANVSSTS